MPPASCAVRRPRRPGRYGNRAAKPAIRRQKVKKPRILVADDEIALADALTRYFARSFDALPFEPSLAAIDRRINEDAPDVVFLDVVFPHGESSLSILRELCSKYPKTAVIINTAFVDRAPVRQVLEAGARGYLLKSEGDGLAEYMRAIKVVLAGGIYLTQSAEADLSNHASAIEKLPAGWEVDVARVVLQCKFSRPLAEVAVLRHHGLAPKVIATRLGISLHTVRARFRHIREKHHIDGLAALMILVERVLGPPLA
jgi:DNA-binding NarL/FixJ family response regulator